MTNGVRRPIGSRHRRSAGPHRRLSEWFDDDDDFDESTLLGVTVDHHDVVVRGVVLECRRWRRRRRLRRVYNVAVGKGVRHQLNGYLRPRFVKPSRLGTTAVTANPRQIIINLTYHFHQKYIQAFIYLKLSFLNDASTSRGGAAAPRQLF